MRKNVIRQLANSKLFLSVLKSIMMIIPLAVAFILVLEISSVNMIEYAVDEFSTSVMSRLLGEVEKEVENAYAVVAKVKNDEGLISYSKKKERNYWEEHEIQKRLKKILAGEKSIQDIYVYFEQYDYILSSTSGYDANLYYKDKDQPPFRGWMGEVDYNSRDKLKITLKEDGDNGYVLVTLVGDGRGPYKGQIACPINISYISEILASLCNSENEAAFLLLGDAAVINTDLEQQEQGLRKCVLESAADKKEQTKFNGVVFDLRYSTSSDQKITIIHAQPQGVTHVAVKGMKIVGVLVIGVCIVMLLGASVVIAKRNYSPFLRLFNLINEVEPGTEIKVSEYEELEKYVRDSIHTKRELKLKIIEYEEKVKTYYLEELLIRGGYDEKLDFYMKKWGFTGAFFAVLLCVFETSDETEDSYQPGDNEWKKDLLEDYIHEYLGQMESFYILEENGRYYCLLNGNSGDSETFECILKTQIEKMKKYLIKSEGFEGDIFVSEEFEGNTECHEAYESVKQKWEKHIASELNEKSEDCSIDRILNIIHDKVADVNLSVAEIAEEMQVTSSYLSRYFKVKMGMGVLEYIHQYRIEQAKILLSSKEKIKVKSVAAATGFYNISTFIRVFKKIEGVTPGQYQELALLDEKTEEV